MYREQSNPNTLFNPAGIRQFAQIGEVPLYRSRELDALTKEDTSFLKHLGITDIYDLRKPREKNIPDYLKNSFRIHSITTDFQFDETRDQRTKADNLVKVYGLPGERMKRMYSVMALNSTEIKRITFQALRSCSPILIHCVNGKDRSGVVCAYIKKALGDSDKEIYRDYLLTNTFNHTMNQRDLTRLSKKYCSTDLKILEAMFEARPEYLGTFWDTLEELPDSFSHFLAFSNRCSHRFSAVYPSKIEAAIVNKKGGLSVDVRSF